ncbi:hypothetical protein ACFQY8_03180 [Alloscardovia venturai]|uniref:Uncharacterized protein n=1 Tax=Alloscardovia venturai TaxID=1769421 RepID=A0ABW2Y838_9BIFI
MFGTKLYMGAPDVIAFKERPWESFIYDVYDMNETLFEVAHAIVDHEDIVFGNLTLHFRLVPGHSSGSIALFFEQEVDGQILRFGMYGGLGLNTLQKQHLTDIDDPKFTMRETYLHSIDSVINEHVDVTLGNHTKNNNVLEKHKQQSAHPEQPSPFIDSTAWQTLLAQYRSDMIELMHNPEQN